MKRTIVLMVVLSTVLWGAMVGASAYTPSRMRVQIGFPFYADDQVMPAGEYWLEISSTPGGTMASSPMAIRSSDGSIFRFLPARAVGSQGRDAGNYFVVFTRIENSYFLKKIQHGYLQGDLPKSRSEKELKLAYSQRTGDVSLEVVKVAAAK